MALYDRLGVGYSGLRRPDPRIGARIRAALGTTGPVLNVGAGAGSYEPHDLPVVAVEPADLMLQQRPPDAAPAVRAIAEQLPFVSGGFAAAMAVLTIHHWSDIAAGLAELRRVAAGSVVILSWDSSISDRYWMVEEYLPASRGLDRDLPRPAAIAELLGGGTVETVEVPADCTDGFYAAWWRRPEAYLDPAVRQAISGIARLPDDEVRLGIERLAADLESGRWHERHRDLLELDELDAGYRLIVSPPNG